ncbi:MAG: aminopeptidase [Chromatiales bacterium]|nr:aminopeptidase [Chromatiales bacterium]
MDYYAQAVGGHVEVMLARRSVADLINDASISATFRARLRNVQLLRAFAVSELALPDNASYSTYADVGRRFVVWNVVATPALSLTPRQWCFPVVGCLSYRGYYQEKDARALAKLRRDAGDDVNVGGVRAYSTLGWFDDPILNTMLGPADPYLAGVMFHELAHQKLYIEDDSRFNEAFATAVEREGVRRWLRSTGNDESLSAYATRKAYQTKFLVLVQDYQQQLKALFSSELDDAQKLEKKHEMYGRMRKDFARISNRWPTPRPYQRFFDDGLNNARVSAVATYFDWVPAFERLLLTAKGDMALFYAKADEISRMDKAQRAVEMDRLGGRL